MSLQADLETGDNLSTKSTIFMPDIAIQRKLSVSLCGLITDLHLASLTLKNCCQQEATPSVTKLSEIGVINLEQYCTRTKKNLG